MRWLGIGVKGAIGQMGFWGHLGTVDKDSFGTHFLFYVTSWKPGLSHLEMVTFMDAIGRVHEHAPGSPKVKKILFFCLVCAFNFGHLITVQHFFKLSDLTGVVTCTPFFPTSV